jgi:branched-chain amino acid transport system ATP-binding protein
MDEPSLGLSPKPQQELFAIIRALRDDGIAVLIVEQNAKKAIETADRTYLLEQGVVVLTGGKDIIKHQKIKEVYLGGA